MPDTEPWELLVEEGHCNPPPINIAAIDQCDAILEECARTLGFALTDRATVEAAILGSSAAYYVQNRIGREPIGPTKAFERELVVAYGLVRWLLVERLHRMEGT